MSDRKPSDFVAQLERLEDRLAPSGSSLLPSTQVAPLGGGGALGPAEVAAVRFRSFGNTGGSEVYLGIPDLGLPGNRVERDYTWTRPGTHYVAFVYDAETYLLYAAAVELETGNSVELVFDRFTEPLELDSILIRLADRDADSQVDFLGVDVDGTSLGDFYGDDAFQEFGFASADLTDGFTISGYVVLDGPFSLSQELSKVEILVGRGLGEGRHPAPGGPAMEFDVGIVTALLAGNDLGAKPRTSR